MCPQAEVFIRKSLLDMNKFKYMKKPITKDLQPIDKY